MKEKDKVMPLLKRGFTLAETAIVLVIVGIIMAGIWQVYGNAKEAQQEADAIQEGQIISKNIVNFMQGRPFQPALVGTEITSNMIAAQAIPAGYVNPSIPTQASNPWTAGGLKVSSPPLVANPSQTFRLSYYNVPYQGCLTLLEALTSCDSNQAGCPIEVYTAGLAASCLPGHAGCTGAAGTGVDWQVINSTTATTLCGANSYVGGLNSVEFDYTF